MAPVLSFTCEEAWSYLHASDETSVLATVFDLEAPSSEGRTLSDEDWQTLLRLRERVNAELELARASKLIGSSLEAELQIQAPAAELASINKIGAELRFWLLCSKVEVAAQTSPELTITIAKSTAPKCARCWHRVASVGSDPQHPEICTRCITNLGDGETRRFV